ncbi:unnamed protein product [Spirodela intermedia]|uniref:Uncharacterized protein n=1 Tax=Spirodela intermedia TaxID=51605 RepID=A0ABN7E7T9_SPIIN|nr:unnamed protein product [Spirodela intermedia]
MSRVVSESFGVFGSLFIKSMVRISWVSQTVANSVTAMWSTLNLSYFEDKMGSNSSSDIIHNIFQLQRGNPLPQLIQNMSLADACDSAPECCALLVRRWCPLLCTQDGLSLHFRRRPVAFQEWETAYVQLCVRASIKERNGDQETEGLRINLRSQELQYN